MHARRTLNLFAALALAGAALGAQSPLPNEKDTLKFAVIGDSGTGGSSQYRVAQRLIAARQGFPFEFVLMLGDNLYGSEDPDDYEEKFERPYKPLLDGNVKFYASLGNHDDPNQRFYKHFNMNGERYYSFKPRAGVRFFALDSNYMAPEQLSWLEKELAGSGSDWKIAFFHHPIYSSGGRHGSNLELRGQLEPLFLKHGVDVVFAGHEHFYERIKPQRGVYYFISGGAAKLREGDVRRSDITAKSFDSGYHFLLVELGETTLHFQVVSDRGQTIDAGSLTRFSDADKKRLAASMTAGRPGR